MEKTERTNQSELARHCGVTSQAVQQWLKEKEDGGTVPRPAQMKRAAEFLGVSPGELQFGKDVLKSAPNATQTDFVVESSQDSDERVFEIEYLDARGSCGGGSLNGDVMAKGRLVKEASWFKKYNLRPADAIVVYADGDSMADFIVDGDMVIFNKAKTEPKSGSIFLIEHPDGLRIKQLRREIDGTWVLESRNPNKQDFPNERIDAAHYDLLRIKGEFVYRQGG